jgi:hypothetical protein
LFKRFVSSAISGKADALGAHILEHQTTELERDVFIKRYIPRSHH